MHKRQPNPPLVMISELNDDQQRKVIRIALAAVGYLASGNDWAAFETIQTAMLSLDEKIALSSLFDSTQRTTLKAMQEAARLDPMKKEA